MTNGELNQAHPKYCHLFWYLKPCSKWCHLTPWFNLPSPPFFCFPLLLPPTQLWSIHSYPFPLFPFPNPPPALYSIPPRPPSLNSVDEMPKTLTVFSHATRRCWPLPMRKWFRIWTKTSSRDSPLSTQSSQEMLLPPLPPSRLDYSSRMDTWTHTQTYTTVSSGSVPT